MTGYTMICADANKPCPNLRLCMPTGICHEGLKAAERQPGHNHMTRELRPQGQCRACDEARKRLGYS